MGKLSNKRRERLPASEFGEPKERKYPINTRARARSALARGSRFLSKGEQEKLAKKIHKRFPGMRIKVLGEKAPGRNHRRK